MLTEENKESREQIRQLKRDNNSAKQQEEEVKAYYTQTVRKLEFENKAKTNECAMLTKEL